MRWGPEAANSAGPGRRLRNNMTKLSLTLPFQSNETLPSYCSRIAAVNGIESASEFSAHFGFRFDRLVKGGHAEIDVFAELVGKMPIQLHRGQLSQHGKTVVIQESIFTREFIDTDRCRVCPACVLRDIGPQFSFHRAYGRTEWMLRFVHTCPDHKIPLVRFGGGRKNFGDFATQIRAIIEELKTHASKPRLNIPIRLQDYVINRMRGSKTQGGWLDDFPLQAAAHFAELLGAVVRDGSEPDLESYTSDDWIEVAEIGFGIAETGESAVRAALQEFLEFNPISRRVRASMFLGRLYAELIERHDLPGYLELGKFLEGVVRERHPNLVSDLPA